MTTLAKLAAVWTAAWSFLVLQPAFHGEAEDRDHADDRPDREEADLRVLMSHWF